MTDTAQMHAGRAPEQGVEPNHAVRSGDMASAAVLSALVEHSQHPLVYLDREFRFVYVNRAYAEACRRSAESFIGLDHFALYPNPENQAIFEHARSTGEPIVLHEKPFVFPDQPDRGVTYWDWRLTPLKDERGAVHAFVFSLRDVTEAVNARERIRASEQGLLEAQRRLAAVMNAVPVGIAFSHDRTCQRVTGNPAMFALFEAAQSDNLSASARDREALGPRVRYLHQGKLLEDRELPLQRAVAEDRAIPPAEIAVELPSGQHFIMECSAAPIRDERGEVTGGVAVLVDITARKHAEEALRDADRRKDQFLAALSHELRNPLAPIKNSLYVLEHAPEHGEQAERAKRVIARQVEQLSRLVDDLLDVTRVSQNKIVLQREHVDLGELVRRAAQDLQSVFERAGVTLELSLPPTPLWLDADPVRLTQIVGNLLQNAAKFTERGGHTWATLTAAEGEGNALLSIVDDGVGMTSSTLERLFEPFAQADASLDRSKGGLGLGLALAKGLVELHGGTISAHSAGLGKGSRFEVRLPRLDVAVRDATHAPDPATVGARRVLVIEDNVDAADSLRDALELGEHEVEVAYSGAEGLARARAHVPDVVLCDIGLPGMDGYQVARAFRADPALRQVYLVALSGYARPEDRARAEQAGFDRHLAKPPALDALVDAIREAERR